jgi:oxygen-independent coproporphyrinogen-3 oxidase
VNRLSLGIQSFDSRRLKALGRIHDGEEARRAVEIARRNFDNFNLDLMYGLPGQSPEEAVADVGTALEFDPPHLSCYHLTIEPNTYFHRFPPRLPDEDAAAAMQDAIEARLAEVGYEHYEVSAYAKRVTLAQSAIRHPRVTDCACRHNLNYWTFGDYLGVGAGAHGKISFPGRIVREARVKHPERYLESAGRADAVAECREIAPSELPFEFMMNALRLNAGVPLALFEERTGLPLTAALAGLDEAERRGLIERDHARIAPTPLGRRFLNDLLQHFLREQAGA